MRRWVDNTYFFSASGDVCIRAFALIFKYQDKTAAGMCYDYHNNDSFAAHNCSRTS